MSVSKAPQPSATVVSSASAPTLAPGEVSGRASTASCLIQVFRRMSEAQRVGQLFLVGIAGAPTAEVAQAVKTYHFRLAAVAGHRHGGRGRRPAGE